MSGFEPVVAHIDSISEASISFSGSVPYLGGLSSVMGGIDRVTGSAWGATALEASDKKVVMNDAYTLDCKIGSRLF